MLQKALRKLIVPASLGVIMSSSMTISMENTQINSHELNSTSLPLAQLPTDILTSIMNELSWDEKEITDKLKSHLEICRNRYGTLSINTFFKNGKDKELTLNEIVLNYVNFRKEEKASETWMFKNEKGLFALGHPDSHVYSQLQIECDFDNIKFHNIHATMECLFLNNSISVRKYIKNFRLVCKELRNKIDSFTEIKKWASPIYSLKKLTTHSYNLDDLSNPLYESNEWRIQKVKVEFLDNNSVLMLGKSLKLLNLPNLKDLCLQDCEFKKTIPDTFFQLQNLKKLEISSTNEKKAPTILNPLIVNLTKLQELNFSGHGYVKFEVPKGLFLPSLTSLNLSTSYLVLKNSDFKAMDFDAFPNLEHLNLAPIDNRDDHSSNIVSFMLDLQKHRHNHENLKHIEITLK